MLAGHPLPEFNTKWEVGHTYAVQPARNRKAVARIRITEICREDVRHIGAEDVVAEGFLSRFAFWRVWCGMHDKAALPLVNDALNGGAASKAWHERPDERYQAWVLSFELVKENEK